MGILIIVVLLKSNAEKYGYFRDESGSILTRGPPMSFIWGILILIYVIPALGVPVAALAGYTGVKMTKKEKKK